MIILKEIAGEDYDAEDEEQQKYVEEVSSSSTTKETTAIAKGFDKIKAYLK